MVNVNGTLQETTTIAINNRGFLVGDSLFETIKVVHNKVLFLEDHYFRLMASMRICRMEIPMNFTMEFFEAEILKITQSYANQTTFRVRFTVFRVPGGYYLPNENNIEFIVTCSELKNNIYTASNSDAYEIELYKDAYVTKQLFSSLKTNNKMIHITGSIFANENGYQNCLLLNNEKMVIEALNANVFIIIGNQLITPPVSDGCLNGIMRKQVLRMAKKIEDLEVVEKSISPFDLQKADELFLTNVITGIQSVTKYRKKEFTTVFALELIKRLNAQIMLN
ncbi:aminotransferase class IV [Flavobacterium sp.]|uniref:aminotransferase class IV n=1 Tax=Flavobacterium sp. TaxID=239 RepID=UPI0035288FF4